MAAVCLLPAPTCLKAWWGTDRAPVSSRYSSQLKSDPSWAESPSEANTFLLFNIFFFFSLQQNVSWSKTYRTPPAPDSCWCPLKAKEFWEETQGDYLPAGTAAGSKGLHRNCNKSVARPHQQEDQPSWKTENVKYMSSKWPPIITLTTTRWSC